MHEAQLAAHQSVYRVVWVESVRLLCYQFSEPLRHSAHCHGAKELTIISEKIAACGVAEAVCLFEDHIEYWREVSRRGIDDSEHFGGCGLLFLRLPPLPGEWPGFPSHNPPRRQSLQEGKLSVF